MDSRDGSPIINQPFVLGRERALKNLWGEVEQKEEPKRARTESGRYRGDDKTTDDVNEAWVGGKSPKNKKK